MRCVVRLVHDNSYAPANLCPLTITPHYNTLLHVNKLENTIYYYDLLRHPHLRKFIENAFSVFFFLFFLQMVSGRGLMITRLFKKIKQNH